MRSGFVLAVLVFSSLLVGGYEAITFYFGHLVSYTFHVTWSLVFLALLVTWVQLDSKEHHEVYRPFEFGFLVFVFWVPYLPYYLVRTRHAVGIVWLLAFVCLFYFGYLLQLLVYAVR